MKIRYVMLIISLFFIQSVNASLITKGVREITEAIVKKGGKKAPQELAEFGGKKAIKEVLEKAGKEGGDELVQKVIRYGRRYGLSAVKVIDNKPALYIKALDEMPVALVERALWAAQREPVVMTRLLSKHGSEALQIAARHRGVGSDIVEKLGNDGIRMARTLSEDQAVTLARYADEIAKLPVNNRNKVIDSIIAAPGRAVTYMEKHPKFFASAAGIAAFVALKDDLIGIDEEITINPDGSRTVKKAGFLDRQFQRFHTPISFILVVIALIVGGWGVVKIWGVYFREKVKVDRSEFALKEEKQDRFDARNKQTQLTIKQNQEKNYE